MLPFPQQKQRKKKKGGTSEEKKKLLKKKSKRLQVERYGTCFVKHFLASFVLKGLGDLQSLHSGKKNDKCDAAAYTNAFSFFFFGVSSQLNEAIGWLYDSIAVQQDGSAEAALPLPLLPLLLPPPVLRRCRRRPGCDR